MLHTNRIAQQRGRRLLWLLPLLSLTLATLACGISLGSHIGYQPPPVTHLPASQLRVAIQITSQYANYSATSNPNAYINIGVFDATNAQEVSLPENAQISCNGKAITRSHPTPGRNLFFSCPREQPGGAYRIAYTDEHGATTDMVIPVLTGTFAILSPQDGAIVPIPTNGTLPVRFTIPTAPANASVAIDSVTAACSVSPAQPCGAVYANLRPAVTATPGQGLGASAVAPLTANLGNATPQPGKTPTRGPTPTQGPTPTPGTTPVPTMPIPTPTVVVTRNGDTGTILLAGDYSQFRPAKGILSLSVEAHVTPDQGDFAAVSVIYSDMLQSYFTWTR
ncbi:MAG TPA: hypothetical protein VGF38_00100 [Ktedonobacterales bacterium]|jgi:hypothetical protein